MYGVASREVVRRFLPEFRFSSAETIYPISMKEYFNHAKLVSRDDETDVLLPNPVNLEALTKYTRGLADNGKESAALTIGEDNFLSQPFAKGSLDAPIYSNSFVNKEGETVINYSVFYAADTGKVVLGVKRIGSHMSDLEHVTVVLNTEAQTLKKVYFSAHTSTEGEWVDAKDLELNQGRIVVYVAAGSHGNYRRNGTYIRFFGWGNDSCNGLGKVWRPTVAEPVTYDMTTFKGNTGGDHVRMIGPGQAWFMDSARNEGGELPYRLPNHVFEAMVLVAIMVAIGVAAKKFSRH